MHPQFETLNTTPVESALQYSPPQFSAKSSLTWVPPSFHLKYPKGTGRNKLSSKMYFIKASYFYFVKLDFIKYVLTNAALLTAYVSELFLKNKQFFQGRRHQGHRRCKNVPVLSINRKFQQLFIETRFLKIGQYLAVLCNQNNSKKDPCLVF